MSEDVPLDDEQRFIILKRSKQSSLVLDSETGETTYRPNDRLVLDQEPEPQRVILERLHEDGPTSIRTFLDTTTLCESDLHGCLTMLRVSGLVREIDVAGEPGYVLTTAGSNALDHS